jgi:integrase
MQQVQNLNSQEDDNKIYYNNFIYSYKTEVTRKTSLMILKYYMKFLGVTTLRELVDPENKPQKIIESDIKAYLVYLRNEKKVSYGSAALYLSVIKKFYVVNTDYQIKWKLINMYLGNDDNDDDNNDNNDDDVDQDQEDRPYTRTEIQKMFNVAQDIRTKIIISLLSSSGLRHGAIPLLKLKDLEKIEKYNIYKITAYRKSKKYKYYTFCTPECLMLIDSYLEYRKKHGEIIKGNSPLIREQFNTTITDKLKINNPRHLTSKSIRNMINDVLTKYTTLRKKLSFDHENKRKQGRNPTMLTHSFRKFFHTECAKAGIYPDYIELMLGHKLPGVRGSYMIPDINTLLEGTKEAKGYVAAMYDYLTINDENRLQKKVEELKQQDDYQKFVIDNKLKNMEMENQELKQELERTKKLVYVDVERFRKQLEEITRERTRNIKKGRREE